MAALVSKWKIVSVWKRLEKIAILWLKSVQHLDACSLTEPQSLLRQCLLHLSREGRDTFTFEESQWCCFAWLSEFTTECGLGHELTAENCMKRTLLDAAMLFE